MKSALDSLILVLGAGAFLALLGGCLVVAGYLVCAGLPGRPAPKERRADNPAHIDLFPW
jgi:hypothetical protein